MTDIYASRSEALLYRKSEARLEQAEQQNDSLELHDVLQSVRRHSLTVSVAQMALKARFTVSLALRSLSVCTAPLCVLLNPVPVSCPPSP